MGYDISDYRAIMKEFGTMDDLDRLIEEAHRRDMGIMMDLVLNHSSDEHEFLFHTGRLDSGSHNQPVLFPQFFRKATRFELAV